MVLFLKDTQDLVLQKLLSSLVIKGPRDLNLQGWSWSHRLEVNMGDLKCELEVHVRVDSHQRSLRGSKLSLVTVVTN